jgi:hypothetical protein
LIKRLEKRARELDRQVLRIGWTVLGYDQQAADDRDLLLEAVKALHEAREFVHATVMTDALLIGRADDKR